MLSFDEILGHPGPTSVLRRMLETGRLPHALLFHGPENVGKATVAGIFAAALLCDRGGDQAHRVVGPPRRQPVLVAPSMNEVMWNQPSTRRNLATLAADGFHIIEPATGWQACRTVGVGRLPEP